MRSSWNRVNIGMKEQVSKFEVGQFKGVEYYGILQRNMCDVDTRIHDHRMLYFPGSDKAWAKFTVRKSHEDGGVWKRETAPAEKLNFTPIEAVEDFNQLLSEVLAIRKPGAWDYMWISQL